jgi:purine-binding chemotaxis protein CheW
MNGAGQSADNGSGAVTQYLTFTLGAEEYGVDILRVQEIKGHAPLTPIPGSPAYVKGVMNLRGTVVPVIGLRERFSLPPGTYDKFSAIVVVTAGARTFGMIVDAVTDVLSLAPDAVEPAPEVTRGDDAAVVVGMGKSASRLIILLDVEQLLDRATLRKEPGVAA